MAERKREDLLRRLIGADSPPPAIKAEFVSEPPGWTRLEPQSVSGDPAPGVEARLHDPCWLLSRQWQLGEFEGEDLGTPVSVEIVASSAPVTAVRHGDPANSGATVPLAPGTPLDPQIEREPRGGRVPGLAARVEAGSQLQAMLAEAGLGGVAELLPERCPLASEPDPAGPDPFDRPAELRLRRLFAGRVADAELIAAQVEPGPPPRPPAWMRDAAGSGRAADLAELLAEWWEWLRGEPAPSDSDSWVAERLEHRFSLGVATRGGQVTLSAPAFGGGSIEWHDLEGPPQGGSSAPIGQGEPVSLTQSVLATPLAFAGMPADRYWEFEDGRVDFAALEVEADDPGRLALAEFAVIYSGDWLVVPLDVPVGSLTELDEVAYTTTFGERFTVGPAAEGEPGRRFRLFALDRAGGEEVVRGLFQPAGAVSRLEGPPLEEVLFGRDEMANMVWAIERRVQGPSGSVRARAAEPVPEQPGPREGSEAELDYLLQTQVPARWIPFVPVARGGWSRELRKGAMLDRGDPPQPVHPLGLLLRPREPLTLFDEEVPREGVRVRRLPTLCREPDGAYRRWIARRAEIGRGEPSSALQFDGAIARNQAKEKR